METVDNLQTNLWITLCTGLWITCGQTYPHVDNLSTDIHRIHNLSPAIIHSIIHRLIHRHRVNALHAYLCIPLHKDPMLQIHDTLCFDVASVIPIPYNGTYGRHLDSCNACRTRRGCRQGSGSRLPQRRLRQQPHAMGTAAGRSHGLHGRGGHRQGGRGYRRVCRGYGRLRCLQPCSPASQYRPCASLLEQRAGLRSPQHSREQGAGHRREQHYCKDRGSALYRAAEAVARTGKLSTGEIPSLWITCPQGYPQPVDKLLHRISTALWITFREGVQVRSQIMELERPRL